MRRFALLALALATATGCASAYRSSEEAGPPAAGSGEKGETVVGRVGPDGAFRADTLAGARGDTVRYERETVMTGAIRRARSPDAPPLQTGYRVQVFAVKERASATDFAREVESLVDGEPVYVEWADPWYKVRVGDFAERSAAERLRERLVDRGIEEAWTIRTTIRTAR